MTKILELLKKVNDRGVFEFCYIQFFSDGSGALTYDCADYDVIQWRNVQECIEKLEAFVNITEINDQ